LIIALATNGSDAPAWADVLAASSDWGVPPWEIAGGATWFEKQRWMRRWRFWKTQIAKQAKHG